MPAVALIGPDGAGKTTVTRMLVESGILPFRYLYMGVDIRSSNIALPTSRLIERIKGRAGDEAAPRTAPAARGLTQRLTRAAWASARLANRIAEQWFRQCVSWYYQACGYVVLYDRHYYFDYSPEITATDPRSVDRSLHEWHLQRIYPRPDLVIFLDAPGALLYERKGELTPDELERRRQGFLAAGRRLPRFVRVDATRPLPDVYAEVTALVTGFCRQQAQAIPVERQPS